MSFGAPELVRYLLDVGAIDCAAVVDGDLVISDCTRRHSNHKVRLGAGTGAGYFVKQARTDQPMSASTLNREAVCYWLAARDARFATLADLMPRCLHYDPQQQVLVLELLPESENLAELHGRLGHVPVETARALGQALGTVHAGVADPGAQDPSTNSFPRTPPWVLGIHAVVARQFERLSLGNAHLLSLIHQYPSFSAALDALKAQWRPDTVIHGDMKWDNCLLLPATGSDAQSTLRVIDWELADIGDPLWDVGGLMHSFLCAWLLSMPLHETARPEQLVAAARHPIHGMRPALHAFWQAYVEARGLNPKAASGALVRCVEFAAARMIQSAYESLSYAQAVSAPTLRLLQVSLNILTRPREALRDLLEFDASLNVEVAA
jgi:hypothetical protein